jgi:hypothetical protein
VAEWHLNQYGLMTGATDAESARRHAWFDTMLHPTSQPGNFCGSPINTGPQTFVLRAAISHLTGGSPRRAAAGARLETITVAPVSTSSTPTALVWQADGLGQTGTQFCASSAPPPLAEQLAALYRGWQAVRSWSRATLSTSFARFLRPGRLQHPVVGAQSDVL